MPWKETCVMEQKIEFILAWKKGELSMAALCRSFGISRQTGYKWVSRFTEDGPEGDFRALEDRPRRPFGNPRQVDRAIEDLVIRARKRHPTWGPRKLRAWLMEPFRSRRPRIVLPAASTMGEILKRHGLARRRRRRRHTPPRTHPFSAVSGPNSVWCVDFKGHFRTKDGTKCYPLTLMDAFSRSI
jgi:transposase InsO family protein